MEYRILGAFEVTDGPRRVELGGLKQRSVLALLLLSANRVVPLDRLIEQLWEEPPPQATSSLQAYISNLRRALEPDRSPREPPRVLRSQTPGYLLVVDPDQCDASRFERLLAHGHALLAEDRPRAAVATLSESLGLWRGPALADFAEQAVLRAEGVRLEELRAIALEERIAAELALGEHARVVAELHRLVAEQPLREQLWGHLMVALYRCGRQGDALAAYQECRRRLGDELGIDPGRALKRLELDVLHQAASLEWRPPEDERAAAVTSAVVATAPAPPVPEDEPAAEVTLGPLVGREQEVMRCSDALTQSLAGRGRVVLISGEAGIGKTRLAEEIQRLATRRGAVTLWGRCHEGEGAPAFWPWIQVLRAVSATLRPAEVEPLVGQAGSVLAPLVPEWGAQGALSPQGPAPGGGRAQLYQAVVNVVCGAAAVRPVVLLLEDLHWADVPSLQLVDFLAPRLDDERLLIVATYRVPEPGTTPALVDTLGNLARFPTLERIALSGLQPHQVRQFIAGVLGCEPDRALVEEVHDRTEGNPFFVTELVRLLQSEGMLGDNDRPSDLRRHVPPGVSDVLRRRLSRLPESTNALLSVAAVIGRDFDLDALARASGVDDDAVLDPIELALVSGLVVETEGVVGRFRFTHALVRETLYQGLSSIRRARIHGRVAEGLESLRGSDDAVLAVDLAHHFWQAVPVLGAARALPRVLRGAETAVSQGAYEAGVEQLQRAVQLLQAIPDSADRAHQELRVQVRLGTMLATLGGGHAGGADVAFGRALELCGTSDDVPELLSALWGLFYFSSVQGDIRAAESRAADLCAVAERTGDERFLLASNLALGFVAFTCGRLLSARECLQRAIGIADELDDAALADVLRQDPRLFARCFCAIVCGLIGDHARADTLSQEAVDLATRLKNPFGLAVTLLWGAWAGMVCGDVARCSGLAERALVLSAERGIHQAHAWSTVFEGWTVAQRGDHALGVVRMRDGLSRLRAGHTLAIVPYFLTLIAESELSAGRPRDALVTVDEAFDEMSKQGDHFYEPDAHRVRGETLLALGSERAAEAVDCLRYAQAVAQRQGARPAELRAKASLQHNEACREVHAAEPQEL